MSRADELRAELALAEAEELLVKAKAGKKAKPDELRAIKNKVRELRAAHRQAREV